MFGSFSRHAELCSKLAAIVSAHNPSDNSIQRLCHGTVDGMPGVIVDKFGELVVISVYELQTAANFEALAAGFSQYLQNRNWILRGRIADSSFLNSSAWKFHFSANLTECDKFTACENEMTFEIRTNPKDDFGIFTDAAKARAWVKEHSKGLRVLNLFSYTCGFGVAACAGGALDVCNIDPNKDYLTWGKRNAQLNNCDFRVVPEKAQVYLKRLCRRVSNGAQKPFDLIVVDPPSFGVGRGNERLVRSLWPEMASAIAQLRPEKILLLFNDKWFRASQNILEFVTDHFPHYSPEWFPGPEHEDAFYQVPAVVALQEK